MSSDADWLNDDSEQVRKDQHGLAIEFAKNYEVFLNNPQGSALLEHWDATLLRKRTPVNASVQQYAADEAVRAFIHGIHDQIKLAQER